MYPLDELNTLEPGNVLPKKLEIFLGMKKTGEPDCPLDDAWATTIKCSREFETTDCTCRDPLLAIT